MTGSFPRAFADVPAWALANRASAEDTRLRFAQFVVLCGIAADSQLRSSLVFKGGNALDFVLMPNRSTRDLDFTLDMASGAELGDLDLLRHRLGNVLLLVGERFQARLMVQAIRQKPPGAHRTFATIEARVGYALPDEAQLAARMDEGRPSPHVVPVEVSLNEFIYASEPVILDHGVPALRFATLEDIVGEKLRAILQQPIRNRSRAQDVLDIAVVVQSGQPLDAIGVAEALVHKSAARGVSVSRADFRNPEIAVRAGASYAALEATTRVRFIPFDEALATVLAFVDSLPIPESHEAA
jgi:predicted nucleotidyltransferase component of viral defense system